MKKQNKKYPSDFSKKNSNSKKSATSSSSSFKKKKTSPDSDREQSFDKPKKRFSKPGVRAGGRFKSKSSFSNKRSTVKTVKRTGEQEEMRLNKFIAHCGICSRRAADVLIKEGKVKVNKTLVIEPGHRVMPNDKVYLEGKEITIEDDLVYIIMNKPKNTITTLNDEKGRRTVIDIIKSKVPQRVYPVGRLDKDTTGLLILTNDGDVAKKLAHPSHGVSKVYHASLDKPLEPEHFDAIKNTLQLEDGPAPILDIQYVINGAPEEIGIEIHIGRNRIVRRIFEHLGYEVVKLDRVYFGGFTKKDIPRGKWRFLNDKEVIMLKHFV